MNGSYEDHPYGPGWHQKGSKGKRGLCSIANCHDTPVVSRYWKAVPRVRDGIMASYCERHAKETGTE